MDQHTFSIQEAKQMDGFELRNDSFKGSNSPQFITFVALKMIIKTWLFLKASSILFPIKQHCNLINNCRKVR